MKPSTRLRIKVLQAWRRAMPDEGRHLLGAWRRAVADEGGVGEYEAAPASARGGSVEEANGHRREHREDDGKGFVVERQPIVVSFRRRTWAALMTLPPCLSVNSSIAS